MDINRLRYFRAVAEAGSVRGAAEAVGLSPAALSKAISLLEQEVGHKLLLPSGRGVVVSQFGRELATRSAKVFDELSSLRNFAEARASGPPPLRIAAFEVFSTWFLGPMLESIGTDRGLELREMLPGELEGALSTGVVDLAVTYLPIPAPDLEHVKAGEVPMGIYARKDRFKDLPLEQIPFVAPLGPVSQVPNRVRGLDGWPEGTIPRLIRYRVSLMESALELCRRGLAAAYLPRFVADLHNRALRPELRLVEVPKPRGLGKDVGMQAVFAVKRKADEETPEFRRVAAVLRRACRGDLHLGVAGSGD